MTDLLTKLLSQATRHPHRKIRKWAKSLLRGERASNKALQRSNPVAAINPDQWYSLPDAARFLGRDVGTLYLWRRQGVFAPGTLLKSRGRYRLLGAEILRQLGEPVQEVTTHIESQREREKRHQRNLKILERMGC